MLNPGCKTYAAKQDDYKTIEQLEKGWCKQSDVKIEGIEIVNYNMLASLFWNTEGAIIRNIININFESTIGEFLIFVAAWYLFTIVTYGTNVPAGLFLPGMIIGCSLGNIMVKTAVDLNILSEDSPTFIDIRKKYIILGCGAFMAGYTRMTYSLGVILMETT